LKANEQATIKEAGKVLAGMLKGNSVLRELDVSDSAVFEEDGGGAAGLAHGLANDISGNGALTTPDARSNNIYGDRKSVLQQAAGISFVPAFGPAAVANDTRPLSACCLHRIQFLL
jgi:hypothetical protein